MKKSDPPKRPTAEGQHLGRELDGEVRLHGDADDDADGCDRDRDREAWRAQSSVISRKRLGVSGLPPGR